MKTSVLFCNCHVCKCVDLSFVAGLTVLNELNRLRMRLKARLAPLLSGGYLAQMLFSLSLGRSGASKPVRTRSCVVDRQNERHMGVALTCA